MGNAQYHSPSRYPKGGVTEYADFFETEEDTFKNLLKRIQSKIRARYKIMADKTARQKHRSQVVRKQLKDVGLRGLDLIKPEAFQLANFLHAKEKIKAAISGHIEDGSSVLLIVTDTRVLYLNVIPLFMTVEEIGFGIMEAVSLGLGQFDASVCLYTAIGNFSLRNVGIDAASKFIEEVESIIEANQTGALVRS